MQIQILGEQPLYRQAVAELLQELIPQLKIDQRAAFGADHPANGNCNILVCCEHQARQPLIDTAVKWSANYQYVILFTAHFGNCMQRRLESSIDLVLPLPVTRAVAAYYLRALLIHHQPDAGQQALDNRRVRNLFIPDPNDLTPAERGVMSLLSKGLSDAAIADELALQVNTVKVHLAHVRHKLKARNRTEAATLFGSMLAVH